MLLFSGAGLNHLILPTIESYTTGRFKDTSVSHFSVKSPQFRALHRCCRDSREQSFSDRQLGTNHLHHVNICVMPVKTRIDWFLVEGHRGNHSQLCDVLDIEI